MTSRTSQVQICSDGDGRFAVEFPLQVEGRTLRVIAGALKGVSTVVLEEGSGSGPQFVADSEWSIVGMRAITDMITALHAVAFHAFGWKARPREQSDDN